MQDLNDLHYFARVIECGGFSAAGRLLGIPKSRLSRRVAELEARLGARLYQHCQAMLQEAEAAEHTVAALAEGRLVRLLPDWRFNSGSLQAAYAHRRGLLPAMRAFIDFLAEAYSREPCKLI